MSKFLTGKPVLVPWDFSELSQRALVRSLDLVSDPQYLRVVYVGQIPVAVEPGMMWSAVTEESIAHSAQHAFQKFLNENPQLPRVQFTTLFGDPGLVLTDHAREIGAELIVISSHGRTGLTRLFLGSVAERVVRFAPCPVLVLRDDAGTPAASR